MFNLIVSCLAANEDEQASDEEEDSRQSRLKRKIIDSDDSDSESDKSEG